MILWIGGSVSPQLLRELYCVDNPFDLSPSNVRLRVVPCCLLCVTSLGRLQPHLPGLPTHFSTQVRHILMYRERQRGRKLKFSIARQDLDGTELDFSDMLMEDQNNDAMSYVDCKCSLPLTTSIITLHIDLCFVHKQISQAVSDIYVQLTFSEVSRT